MKSTFFHNIPLILAFCFALWSCQDGGTQAADAGTATTGGYERIVSLSGALTETLYTLGHGDKVVGVDVTSTYPTDVERLPKVGHVSQLNAEGILGLRPDLIVAESREQNNPVLRQLLESGVEILWLERPNTLEAPLQMARTLADKLGDPAGKLTALEQKIDGEKAELQALLADRTERPRVLFIYARGKGNLMVAGRNTPAEAMITAAGGENAVTEFEDFQALSAEGLIQARPDVILMFDSGLQSLNGLDAMLQIPGVSQTPAGQARRIVAMEGHYLLGFGPRATQAAVELAQRLHREEPL